MSFVNTEWPRPPIDPLYGDDDEPIGDESEEVEILRGEEIINAIAEKYLQNQHIAFGIMIEATPLQEAGKLKIVYQGKGKPETVTAIITEAEDLKQLNGYKAACDAWKSTHSSEDVPTLPYI